MKKILLTLMLVFYLLFSFNTFASTITVSPVAGANSPCDGYLGSGNVDLTWEGIRLVTPQYVGATGWSYSLSGKINCYDVNGKPYYMNLDRGIMNFNTAALGSASIIFSASVSLYAYDKAITGT